MPWERVEKDYVFDSPARPRPLADLFEGRRQLLVQHFMLGPGWEQGCPSCSYMADHTDGMTLHLAHRDTSLVAISRAPLAEIQRFKAAHRLAVELGAVVRHDFNMDFRVSFAPESRVDGRGAPTTAGHAALPVGADARASACFSGTTRARSSTPIRPSGAAWK